jgi:hypothetical protein
VNFSKKCNICLRIDVNKGINTYYCFKTYEDKDIITEESFTFNEFRELTAHIRKGKLRVSITGDVILHKIFYSNANFEDKLSTLMPGFNDEEYYYSKYIINENQFCIALAKKKSIDIAFKEISRSSTLTAVFLGSLYAINYKLDKLDNYELEWLDSQLMKITYVPPMDKNAPWVNAKVLNSIVIHQHENANILSKLPTISDSSNTSLTLKYAVVIFIFLLVNFLMQNYLTKANEEMKYIIQQKSSFNKHLDSIELVKKIRNIEARGITSNSDKQNALILNQIGKSVTDNIILNELIFHPIRPKDNSKDHVSFDESLIIIKGVCRYTTSLEQWINSLLKFPFISEVELKQIVRKSDSKNEFSISILTKP